MSLISSLAQAAGIPVQYVPIVDELVVGLQKALNGQEPTIDEIKTVLMQAEKAVVIELAKKSGYVSTGEP